jgi:hypothetical protein
MSNPKLNISENKTGLNEIGHGANQVEMAFIDEKTGNNISQIIKCKDFFQDIFWSRRKGQSSSIFGFSWNHKHHEDIFSRDFFSIFARIRNVPTEEVKDIDDNQIKNLQNFLNEFASKLDIPLCEVQKDSTGKYAVIKFHKSWTEIPYLNSAFFLYVRLGLSYDGESNVLTYIKKGAKFISANDALYVKNSINKIEDMLKGKLDKRQTYDQYKEINAIHNSSGIVNYKDYKIE